MSEFRFSRRTVLAAAEMLEGLSQAKFTRYLLELGPQYTQWIGPETISLTKRINNLVQVLDQMPNRVTEDGELLRDRIVEKAISLMPANEPVAPWQMVSPLRPVETSFLRALEMDGFTLSDGVVRSMLPSDLKLPETESELVRLLNKHSLPIPLGHLNQALDAHGRGDWAAANGQIRTFLDSIMDEILLKIDPTCVGLKTGQPRRSKLASLGFLSKELNEWDDNGLGFINGLVKRLHPQGAHPGLSNDTDSTFRLHLVLLTARMLLVRYHAGVTRGNPVDT